MTITPAETRVLAKVASQLGRRWKAELAAIWASGAEANRLRLSEDELATLRRIRNTHGPRGLRSLVLEPARVTEGGRP